MRRRTFVAGLAATAGFPSAALAQASGAVPEIALLYTGPMASAEARAKMVRDDLGADGFVEGKNFAVSISVAKNNSEELKPHPAERQGDPGDRSRCGASGT
jgi:hypothetical protein